MDSLHASHSHGKDRVSEDAGRGIKDTALGRYVVICENVKKQKLLGRHLALDDAIVDQVEAPRVGVDLATRSLARLALQRLRRHARRLERRGRSARARGEEERGRGELVTCTADSNSFVRTKTRSRSTPTSEPRLEISDASAASRASPSVRRACPGPNAATLSTLHHRRA